MTTLCWCPACQGMREMRLTETLALLVCQTCGGAFTAADLQEAAYDDGYRDGLAERAPAARERRRP